MKRLHHHIHHHLHHHVIPLAKIIFWFSLGGLLGLLFFVSFLYIGYQRTYQNKVYPGVFINHVDMSGMTEDQVRNYFDKKNERIADIHLLFTYKDQVATISARQLDLGYNSNLLAMQAISVGRDGGPITNASLLLQIYLNGLNLSSTYQYSEAQLSSLLAPLEKQINKQPTNASFTFQNNRVTTFQLAKDGQQVNDTQIREKLLQSIPQLEQKSNFTTNPANLTFVISLPVDTLHPQVSDASANSYGITELIASGTSLFAGSIDSRIFNIGHAASKLEGVLIPPGQVFSFDQTVGDISSLSGYKQAYVIENGHTVLGDGGGVCQVSTTLFRAILNAGLPIVERHAHAYEVHYYTEDAPLGYDAAIYSPTVDFKFKNDTAHYILIHTIFQPEEERLTFELYGTSDGRQVSLTQPIITNIQPAPAPLYQDDPTLPNGTVKQIDFAAPGATATFSRTVTKNGKPIISDTFVSNFRPWQAVYLRGTKTN